MDRLTRKELKKDRFALEVGHTVEFLGVHRQQFYRYGAIGLAVVLLLVGWFYYSRSQQATRQRELRAAMTAMGAPIGPSPAPGIVTFSSPTEKNKAVTAALTNLATKYRTSQEGIIGEYYLAGMALDQGRQDEAVKRLTVVADSGNQDFAALAQFTLAQIYADQGKTAEAEKMLRVLVDKPSVLISKDEATIALARLLVPTKPQEVRQLLDKLRSAQGAVGHAAIAIYGETLNRQ